MSIVASRDRLPVALLELRLLVFGVFLMWALEKLINPGRAVRIYEAYYSLSPATLIVITIGVLELVLLAAFLVGYRKRLTRAVLLAMMGVSCLAPGRFYLTPFHDHILLYFAAFPTLAVIFTLYYLRDRDTLWLLPSAREPTPAPTERTADDDPRLPLCLLLIRLGVFLVMFMWTMDKFFHPLQTSRIFLGFYGVGADIPGTSQLSYEIVYMIGAVELVLVSAFVLGLKKRLTYGLIFVLHTISTLAPGERFLQPFSSHTLLFLVSFTMLGGIAALYYLRDRDVLWVLGSDPKRDGAAIASHLVPPSQWSRPAQAVALLAIAATLYIFVATIGQRSVENERGPALIAEVQRQYAASDELESLSPEWETAEWTATWHSANCTFSNPEIADCWELHFIVWVPEVPGRVMAGRRQIEAGWIVDASSDTAVFRPDRNARAFFRPLGDSQSITR